MSCARSVNSSPVDISTVGHQLALDLTVGTYWHAVLFTPRWWRGRRVRRWRHENRRGTYAARTFDNRAPRRARPDAVADRVTIAVVMPHRLLVLCRVCARSGYLLASAFRYLKADAVSYLWTDAARYYGQRPTAAPSRVRLALLYWVTIAEHRAAAMCGRTAGLVGGQRDSGPGRPVVPARRPQRPDRFMTRSGFAPDRVMAVAN
jgi:hypothetical protein